MSSADDMSNNHQSKSCQSSNDQSDADASMSPRQHLLELSREELRSRFEQASIRRHRVGQLRRWVFAGRARGFEEMTDLPVELREQLGRDYQLFESEIVDHRIASDRTEKLLLKLRDGHLIETVVMREPRRTTVCISSQVGCAMGCVFCASGLLGVKRNLTRGEILEQVLRADRLLDDDERLTNLVVMGVGEPLANLKNLVPALEELNASDGLAIGARRITVSTVGLPEKIIELSHVGPSWNLAVSLHAPNDELRSQLVPVNKSTGIDAILAAADKFFENTGRRITYEYVLLGGVNDGVEHARELSALLSGRVAHVNLIPMNGVSELPFAAPSDPQTDRFVGILREAGVVVTVRKRKGADIDAACGQLRLNRETDSQLPVLN
ncbi:23S rRNA (adenine(2503)-C(2))-methyltransferase RlmN [Stratiformator vulcanicus]|uniref:Probable dual-specificity RNA methyltransferase RlmN n=1 Tax=Stratiformator vulcanicus TaxID=2527980 RepID=A0A517R5N2_9PLAN|nr:23S rRNA (adenine(2503)-C(2))-methyltransferase RlmN [Stratiformator vulcanicus]QDT39198.1 putative dual-specificity RNA methyltransferase RlmN [Stratiformator vulcanicus]